MRKNSHYRLTFLALALPALLLSGASSGAVGAAQAAPDLPPTTLANHRASYDLSLLKSDGAKGPTSVRGRIAFNFIGSPCEGYTQNLRQFVELQPPEGDTQTSDTRTATFEDGRGEQFRFKIDSGAGADRDVDGKAQKSTNGELNIVLTRPSVLKLDLAEKVLFPTEYLLKILDAARAGEKVYVARVFDGTDTGQKIFDATAVIGKASQGPDSDKASQAPQLASLRRWPVAVSYFENGDRDASPAYVLSFDLYENGVSSALKLDYGDFVLKGEMTSLEFLPPGDCKK